MTSDEKVPLLSLSCREASRLISESLDRELTRRERWALKLHIVLCSACRKFAQFCNFLRQLIDEASEGMNHECAKSTTILSAERRAQIKRYLSEMRQTESHD